MLRFCLLLLLSGCLSELPKITLLEPLNSALYIVDKAAETTSTIVVYEILNLTNSLLISPQLCVQLVSVLTDEELFPLTCSEALEGVVSREFNSVPSGSFRLILSLNADNLHDTHEAVKIVFHVKRTEELLPKIAVIHEQIAIRPGDLNVVAVTFGDATIEYHIGATLLDMDKYEVCVQLRELNTNADVLQLTCSPTNARTLNFHYLNLGFYSLSLTFAEKNTGELGKRILYQLSEKKLLINVKIQSSRIRGGTG